MGDYYTEDIPVDDDEEEILELLPISNTKHVSDTRIDLIDDDTSDDLVIEEDAFETAKKAKLHMHELERTLKNKSLYKSHDLNEESKLRNRLFRLKMLENELKSLKSEIDNDTKGKNNYLTDSIDKLSEDITQVKINDDNWINHWNDKFNRLEINQIEIKNSSTNATEKCIDESIVKFDSRLGVLESHFSKISSTSSTLSLQDTIEDLYRKTNIILDNGGTIGDVQLKITKLLDDCEEISKKMKHSPPISLTDEKILKLYQRIEQIPKFESIIPMIYQRLKSINSITMKGVNSITFLNELEDKFNKIEKQIDIWDSKLDSLETQLVNNEVKFNEFREAKNII